MIITQYPETMTSLEKYNMMNSPEIKKMSDAVGKDYEITAYMLREDRDTTITVIRTSEGVVYATNSPTVARSFEEITEIGIPKKISIFSGTSRAGRKYTDVKCLEFAD